jgi:hypothetical protein
MDRQRRSNASEWPSPRPCRHEAEPETDAGPEAGAEEDASVASGSAVEADVAHRRAAYVAHRWTALYQALEDLPPTVTGPVRDAKSTGPRTGPRLLDSWENLEAQLVHGPFLRYVSLDGLWRAVGSPAGKGPLEWLALARPLVPAFHRYFENLAACGYHEKSELRIYVFIEKEDLDDDHRAGDVTTSLWLIAQAYASFLDSVVTSDG